MAQTQSTKSTEPIRGFAQNGPATFVASGNPCVDFFFKVVPTTPSNTVVSLLTAAWKHDSLTALKLLCHLRGVSKERFYTGALWLHRNHPKTLSLNVTSFAEFGYMKDLLEILFRILHGNDIREKVKKGRWQPRVSKKHFRARRIRISRLSRLKRERVSSMPSVFSMPKQATLVDYIGVKLEAVRAKNSSMTSEDPKTQSKDEIVEKKKVSKLTPERVSILPKKATLADYIEAKLAEIRAKNSSVISEPVDSDQKTEFKEEKVEKKISKSKNPKKQKMTISLANKAVFRYTRDSKCRFLYDRVAEFFAAMLASDLKHLSSGKIKKIGLAAKWCPSLDKLYDCSTRLCEAIARLMFPRNSDPEYKSIAEEQYVYRIRNRLKREVLVPIRKVLRLPEVYTSAQQWRALPYSRVAFVAMNRYKKHFKTHDEKRFEQNLTKVGEGKAKNFAGALLPHEIASLAYRAKEDKVVELQWQRMVNDLLEKRTLSNCISVCDVSVSMHGTPMEVCVALGVLVSELSKKPWKGKVITFHERPSIRIIHGNSLKKKMNSVRTMPLGVSTNFQAVFEQILQTAVQANIKPEEMVKKVFVFSDMEFNVARGGAYHGWNTYTPERGSWETDYEVICQKFAARGFGDAVPEVVFWNLRDSRSTPATEKQKGLTLISGFSKILLKVFLEGKFVPTPEEVMMEAISGREYQNLVVFD